MVVIAAPPRTDKPIALLVALMVAAVPLDGETVNAPAEDTVNRSVGVLSCIFSKSTDCPEAPFTINGVLPELPLFTCNLQLAVKVPLKVESEAVSVPLTVALVAVMVEDTTEAADKVEPTVTLVPVTDVAVIVLATTAAAVIVLFTVAFVAVRLVSTPVAAVKVPLKLALVAVTVDATIGPWKD